MAHLPAVSPCHRSVQGNPDHLGFHRNPPPLIINAGLCLASGQGETLSQLYPQNLGQRLRHGGEQWTQHGTWEHCRLRVRCRQPRYRPQVCLPPPCGAWSSPTAQITAFPRRSAIRVCENPGRMPGTREGRSVLREAWLLFTGSCHGPCLQKGEGRQGTFPDLVEAAGTLSPNVPLCHITLN